MPRRQPRWPSMGLASCSAIARARSFAGIGAGGARHFLDFLVLVRQEFVQRRIEQADGDRQAFHHLEDRLEIAALHRQQFGQRGFALVFGIGQDHLAHRDDAVGVEEHMLGAAKADAFGAEVARRRGVGGRVGIGAHLQRADRIRPAHQRAEIAGQFRLAHRHLALEHLARGAIDGDDVAALDGDAADRHLALRGIDLEHARAGDAGPPHAARHHGRVAGHAAARGENALAPHACRECLPGWFRCAPG